MSKLIEDVKIGADPESFLWSDKLNKFVPVCGLVGGTKEKPIFITEKGHALQEDNVMIEWCIPPCTTAEEFIKENNFVKDYIRETVLKPLNLSLKSVASATFDREDLLSSQAETFGCSESFNAWTGQVNVVGRDNPLLRTAGFHIHVGYKNPNLDTTVLLMQAMDLFLGVGSILLDTDVDRRKVYGKAGEYRLKQYGGEYRVLSAALVNTDELMNWVVENTFKAIDFVNSKGIITNPQDIIECINTSNREMAYSILEDYNIEILQLVN